MAGQSAKPDERFQRLAALPPYVLATVDELKSRLRAAGHDVYDFGLGNPDGASPRAAVERLIEETQTPGNQRYMPSRGVPEARKAICDWYARKYGQSFDPDGEAVVTLGAKEGLAHLLLAIVGPGDCVLSPDPCYPIHRFGVSIAGGEPVPVATGPGRDAYAEIEKALARAPRKPKGLIVNFPHNPTSAVADLAFFQKVVALAKRESLWVISDLAYADLMHDGQPSPSIFQVRRRARHRRRVLHGVEELFDAGLARRLLRRQPPAGGRAHQHQGLPRLRQLRARAAGRGDGAGVLRRRRRREPRRLQAPREAAVHRAGGGGLDGPAAGRVDVRVGAAAGPGRRNGLGALRVRAARAARGWRSRPASDSALAARDSSASRWSRRTTARAAPVPRSAISWPG
jgi:hypothetical protein